MASVDVDQLEEGEELADQRDHLVGDVLALRPADKQRGLRKADLVRVLEGEVAQVVEGLGQDVQRHAELLGLAVGGAVQVAEQKLADREGLLVVGH